MLIIIMFAICSSKAVVKVPPRKSFCHFFPGIRCNGDLIILPC